MQDLKNREDIERIVSDFYHEALQDEKIGYIFTEIAHLDLVKHIPTICNFWETILFGNNIYRGSVVSKHIELHKKSPLLPTHFEAWLLIWIDTVNKNFAGEKADEMIRRAKLMAEMMKHKINYFNHNPNMLT